MKEHNLEAFIKYYSNATKEEVIEDMYLDNCKLGKEIYKLENRYEKCKRKKIQVENKCSNYKYTINKAIEYIEKTNFWGIYEDTPMSEVLYGSELLEILRGDKE